MPCQRVALVLQALRRDRPLSLIAKDFGVSRKTAYKWLARYHLDQHLPLLDQPRTPRHSPARTSPHLEHRVLQLRRQFNWGPRKIHRLLFDDPLLRPGLPSVRTVAAILKRHHCIPPQPSTSHPASTPHSFERAAPNELWQLDHKGPLEVDRQRVVPLTILDDHSRYCLCFHPLPDTSLASLWPVLWNLFGDVGLPDAILCDNAFSGRSVGLSSFDAALVRLNIHPLHGRPYHPQTQGKVERLHASVQRELLDFNARRDNLQHFTDDCSRWRHTYNSLRPHEALGDLTPATRWIPSDRKRPPTMPTDVDYPPNAITRRVSVAGDFRYHNARIVVGRALCGQTCLIQPRQHDIAVFYAWKLLRIIPNHLLGHPRNHTIV